MSSVNNLSASECRLLASKNLFHSATKWNVNLDDHMKRILAFIHVHASHGDSCMKYVITPYNSSGIGTSIIHELEGRGFQVETLETSHSHCFQEILIVW